MIFTTRLKTISRVLDALECFVCIQYYLKETPILYWIPFLQLKSKVDMKN